MDRRDALRKLAVGGATAMGATAIVSQPAFAYAVPVVTQTGIVQIVAIDAAPSRRFDISVTQNATATCPNSVVDPGLGVAVVLDRVVTVTSLAMQAGHTWFANGNIAGSGTRVPPGATRTVSYTYPTQPAPEYLGRVRKRSIPLGSGTNKPVVAGDSFRIDVAYRFQCSYPDGTKRTTTSTFSSTFTA